MWLGGGCPAEVGGELIVEFSSEGSRRLMKIAALRKQGRFDVIRFEGVEDRTQAKEMGRAKLFIPAQNLKALPKGEYYCYQILGLEVETEDGSRIGTVEKVFTAGENDVYEVLPEGKKRGQEILIPAIEDVIVKIDLEAKKIIIRPLKGMLDQN